jgi:hypothetical protein
MCSRAVVVRALADAENLLRTTGATSGVDRVHTALHGHLLALCDQVGVVTQQDAAMTAIFKALRREHPALQDPGPRRQDIEKVLNAASSIFDALGPVRNRASVAHPEPRVARRARSHPGHQCRPHTLELLGRKAPMRQQRRFHDSDGIGAPEIRNFEVKLQSHSPKTRIGVLVAAGGFTREAINAVKRASRDSYSIALVRPFQEANSAPPGAGVAVQAEGRRPGV